MSNENKVFVGNLPYSISEDDIRTFFADCGDIQEVKLISDRETGRPRGFGFVTFGSDSALSAALGKNNADFNGRPVKVNKAESKQR